ncbi:hypothetical protein O181_082196 [Austropuccinia psidii MF-1]|uniref:Uncharacterized protein n=1 Tax=Austropuccinia psidii MF-1 TaxID=1389203 RepID=A0A9Q3FS49_9BASI|nr:hypothetical protein [Austropuccinia psidii MF-1]
MWPHRPPDETPTLPPISILTTPYTFTPPPLPSLCLWSALPTCSQHHLSLHLCSALPTLLTILTLAECPPNTAYHPYACVVPSRHHLSLRLCITSIVYGGLLP